MLWHILVSTGCVAEGFKTGFPQHTQGAQGEDQEQGENVYAGVVGPFLAGAACWAVVGAIASGQLSEEQVGGNRGPQGICAARMWVSASSQIH